MLKKYRKEIILLIAGLALLFINISLNSVYYIVIPDKTYVHASPGVSRDFYKNELDEDLIPIYDRIYSALLNGYGYCYLDKGLDTEDVIEAMSALRLDDPFLPLVWSGEEYGTNAGYEKETGYTVFPVYSIEFTDRGRIFSGRILDNAALSDDDDKKVEYIFNCLTLSGAVYTEGSPSNPVYFFNNKEGVCTTFSRAFQMLLDESGIPNTVLTGTYRGDEHMWNFVYYNDSWHQFDMTAAMGHDFYEAMSMFNFSDYVIDETSLRAAGIFPDT